MKNSSKPQISNLRNSNLSVGGEDFSWKKEVKITDKKVKKEFQRNLKLTRNNSKIDKFRSENLDIMQKFAS